LHQPLRQPLRQPLCQPRESPRSGRDGQVRQRRLVAAPPTSLIAMAAPPPPSTTVHDFAGLRACDPPQPFTAPSQILPRSHATPPAAPVAPVAFCVPTGPSWDSLRRLVCWREPPPHGHRAPAGPSWDSPWYLVGWHEPGLNSRRAPSDFLRRGDTWVITGIARYESTFAFLERTHRVLTALNHYFATCNCRISIIQ
jgi:hypothetical protein